MDNEEEVHAPRRRRGREDEVRMDNPRMDDEREMSWRPPQAYPDLPTDDPDWVYRWCRKSLLGTLDKRNMSTAYLDGWRPVPQAELPEVAAAVVFDIDGEDSEHLEFGGLIACRMPRRMAEQRRDHYIRVADSQMRAVDAKLRAEKSIEFSINRKSRMSDSLQ